MRGRDIGAAALALAGVSILMPRLQAGDATTQGVFWGVVSGLAFALLSLLNRRCGREHAPTVLALYQDAFAALILLPFVVVEYPVPTARDIALLFVLGIVCTAVAHSLFIVAMRGIKARSASMIACLEPFYGTAFAALILREVPSLRTLVAGSVVLGVAFYASASAGR